MKKLLSDASKFEGFEIPPDKHLNFVINCWDKIKNILEALYHEESLTDMSYKSFACWMQP